MIGLFIGLVGLTINPVHAQLSLCDTDASFSATVSNANTTSPYVVTYVLVDSDGTTVLSTNMTGMFTMPAAGSYTLYAVNHDGTATFAAWPASGSCMEFISQSVMVDNANCPGVTVCETASFTVTASNDNTDPGYTKEYVLVCDGNVISANTTGTFDMDSPTDLTPTNNCDVYAVNYLTADYDAGGLGAYTTWADITAVGGCLESITRDVTITPTDAAPVIDSDTDEMIVCNGGTITETFSATCGVGCTTRWYDAATGGTQLGTGSTFDPNTDPRVDTSVTGTINYYVECDCGCPAPREMVTLTVISATDNDPTAALASVIGSFDGCVDASATNQIEASCSNGGVPIVTPGSNMESATYNSDNGTVYLFDVVPTAAAVANAQANNTPFIAQVSVDCPCNFTRAVITFDCPFDFEGPSCTQPLPVELLFLEGSIRKEVNVLDWATASEINNSHFEVERSKNGVDFNYLGKVEGNGNSSTEITYSFIDTKPELVSYYRLKQVDLNGEFSYTNVITLKRKTQGISFGNIYPSPTKG
ncbi:MAG: immunoglobulin domain-containing protein, partial [Saprospiraceae bacterium]